MLNIVIPMAGLGSRFAVAGYTDPKPMIKIHGIQMIRWVIANLTPAIEHRFIFIAQQKHAEAFQLDQRLADWAQNSKLIVIDGLTDGAARTVLAAKEHINSNEPLVIANSDQWVHGDIEGFYESMMKPNTDGLIMTMKANDPKWSFIAKDGAGLVSRVVEKQVISDDATVGIYAFARGADFVAGAAEMIENGETVNGEYYVAPVYNILISKGSKVRNYEVGSESDGMYGLGIPSDLQAFERTELSTVLRAQLWK
jgi:dTDP-glucose pyrophosphorylase